MATQKAAAAGESLAHDMTQARAASEIVKSAVADLRRREAEATTERDALIERNERLRSLPVNRSDAKRFILDMVDRVASEYVEVADWGAQFKAVASPRGAGRAEKGQQHLTMRDVEQVLDGGQLSVAHVFGSDFGSFFYGGASLLDMAPTRVCFFFGDLIKKKIDEHFEQLFPSPWQPEPDADSTLEERRSEIARNDQRISELNSMLTVVRREREALGDRDPPPPISLGHTGHDQMSVHGHGPT